jgi:hypothetical protein
MRPVEIEFFKPERRCYRSVLHRRDGLVIELDGGGYNKVGGPARELPHDLTHACRALRETSVNWADLRPGEALTVVWRLPPPR